LKASQIVSDEEEESGDVSLDRRSRRERVQELRDRQSNRKRRMRESEKLMSDFVELEDRSERKLRNEKAKMEEDDAALAAAISAGYFSDDEKDLEHVRLRNGTRFKDNTGYASSTATTPTFNPYARNGLGAYSGPMRRSERNAAVVSAARVAMYTSMLNPDSSVYHSGTDENSQLNGGNKYNLRPNRHGDSSAGAAALPSGYYEYNSADRSGAADTSDRLFEEDDVDGNLNVNRNDSGEGSGEVSLAALDKIAGMDGYVRKLKEMIVFPLVYPQLFSKLNVSLPRGVLFHGPPGTGKTLMARLLASACSTSTRKVSFFMRNGSDCLSKWIGEAERNMRLLFKKAKDCQPSIIFFDEIDGLAPERTARQDQSHISLVSTLLALMDGLDDRGQVVVIGATNRIHSIDAALRRPGRFDREFFFSLPDEAARSQILKIHTKTWEPAISDSLADDLACRTAGFSGADMKVNAYIYLCLY
jgi:ATPase family AAA domain-containing protein 2